MLIGGGIFTFITGEHFRFVLEPYMSFQVGFLGIKQRTLVAEKLDF